MRLSDPEALPVGPPEHGAQPMALNWETQPETFFTCTYFRKYLSFKTVGGLQYPHSPPHPAKDYEERPVSDFTGDFT